MTIIEYKEIQTKLKNAVKAKLSFVFQGKPLKVNKVYNIGTFVMQEKFKEKENYFTCEFYADYESADGSLTNGQFKTLNSTFTISETGEVIINEPVILIKK